VRLTYVNIATIMRMFHKPMNTRKYWRLPRNSRTLSFIVGSFWMKPTSFCFLERKKNNFKQKRLSIYSQFDIDNRSSID